MKALVPLVFTLSLVAGFGLAWWPTAESGYSAPKLPSAMPTEAVPGTPECAREARALRDQARALRVKLAEQDFALRMYAREVTEREGVPTPWTVATDPLDREETFTAALTSAAVKAGGAVEVVSMDCVEYPCIPTLRASSREAVLATLLAMEGYDGYVAWHTASHTMPPNDDQPFLTSVVWASPGMDPEVARRAGFRLSQITRGGEATP